MESTTHSMSKLRLLNTNRTMIKKALSVFTAEMAFRVGVIRSSRREKLKTMTFMRGKLGCLEYIDNKSTFRVKSKLAGMAMVAIEARLVASIAFQTTVPYKVC
ncbi:unnamed protein product [Microthlaspi erraticum]|uniref:Uncharacterized protein n=1 Tax=Microthlaspi erraticum TaxID=1685480 RepID=A0A6D2KAM7_9BRAS|nr:unnamed protein product [Microthlaspi erraticum]